MRPPVDVLALYRHGKSRRRKNRGDATWRPHDVE
jgi:hypothetical protein